jgi:hypothetical protein
MRLPPDRARCRGWPDKRRQFDLTDFLGFLDFRGLADAGLMLSGFRVVTRVTTGAASGSGALKNTRQPGESWDLFRIMQTVTRSTSGISGPHRRNASPEQACCCSGV